LRRQKASSESLNQPDVPDASGLRLKGLLSETIRDAHRNERAE
jgi:hypothetical protein